MKKRDLFPLYNGLNDVSNLKGIKFNYAVSRNKKRLKPELESIQESNATSDEYKKYDKARVELCVLHSKKDAKGNPVMADSGRNYIMSSPGGFQADLKDLKEEHKEAVDIQEEKDKQYESLMDEKSDIEIHKVALDEIDEEITGRQFESIKLMIEDY